MNESLSKSFFSDDFSHFETNHAAFPMEAQSVLCSVEALRVSLNEFRKATENKCVIDDDVAIADVLSSDVPSELDTSFLDESPTKVEEDNTSV